MYSLAACTCDKSACTLECTEMVYVQKARLTRSKFAQERERRPARAANLPRDVHRLRMPLYEAAAPIHHILIKV